MKVCFVSTEREEEAFFAGRLAEWKPRFFSRLDEVPADVGVLSIFIYDGIDEAFLEAHAELRLIATRTTATDHIDVEACERRGVRVACVGGSDGNSVAEHTFALLLAIARRLRMANHLREQGDFSREELRGFELRGKKLGLIGVGRIGARVAELAHAFGMEVRAYDPMPVAAHAARVGFRYDSFAAVLEWAEILSLHAPLTAATRHLLDAEALAKCQEGVIILNTARGGLIDTPALVAALKSGQVGGVGLDVLDDERVLRADAKDVLASEIAARVHRTGESRAADDAERSRQIQRLYAHNALLSLPEVVFTPHIAFNTAESEGLFAEAAAKNIEDFLRAADVA